MSLEDDILIENYLRKNLSKIEESSFLNRLDSDERFKEGYLFERQLYLTLNKDESEFGDHNKQDVEEYTKLFKGEDTKKIKEVLEKVNKDYQAKKNPNNSLRWILSTAALFAVFVTVYSLFLKPISSQELYAIYVDKNEIPSLIVRGANNKNLVLAQQYFEEEAYKKSLLILNDELKNSKITDANIYLYIGVSQLELNQFNNAEETFNLLIRSNFLDAPKGKWYMALLFIKKNNIPKAKELLTEIVNTSSYNYLVAEKLLKKLD